jgi:hypothetical protein
MLMDFQTPESPKDGVKNETAQPAEQLRQAITQADSAAHGGAASTSENMNRILGELTLPLATQRPTAALASSPKKSNKEMFTSCSVRDAHQKKFHSQTQNSFSLITFHPLSQTRTPRRSADYSEFSEKTRRQ